MTDIRVLKPGDTLYFKRDGVRATVIATLPAINKVRVSYCGLDSKGWLPLTDFDEEPPPARRVPEPRDG